MTAWPADRLGYYHADFGSGWIKQILFDRWLEARRADAEIEWCWGNA